VFARFRRDEGGASATEFALVAPLFLAFIYGLFQVGWALHCASSVRYALEESARSVMLDENFTSSQVEGQMRARLSDIADPEIDVAMTTETQSGMTLVHLDATYVHDIVIPFLPPYEVTFDQQASVARPT
jgi:Flp pilus assembly protein TadG